MYIYIFIYLLIYLSIYRFFDKPPKAGPSEEGPVGPYANGRVLRNRTGLAKPTTLLM